MEKVGNRKFSFLNDPAIHDLNHIGGIMAVPLASEMRCSPVSEVYAT